MPERHPAPAEAHHQDDPESESPTPESPTAESAATESTAPEDGVPAEAPTVEVAREPVQPAEPPAPSADATSPSNAWFKAWEDERTRGIPLTPPAPDAAAPAPGSEPSAEAPTVATEAPGLAAESPTVATEAPVLATEAPAERTPITNSLPISQAIASVDPVTEQIPVSPRPAAPAGASDEPPTVTVGPPETGREKPRRRGRTLAVVGGGAVVLLGALYGIDLATSQGSVPRGVTVAGIPLGGLALADAEQTVRAQLEPRTTKPIDVTVGAATSSIAPADAGLTVDWDATVATAGEQPLNPITRLTSFFGAREVGVVTVADEPTLEAAVGELSPIVDKPAADGTIRFEGVTPIAVDPVAGQKLDVPGAAATVREKWLDGGAVALPLTTLPATTTPDDVAKAIATIARPAVSGPVTVTGEGGTSATLTPDVIATSLRFHPNPAGGIIGEVNPDALTTAAGPALAASEKPGRDATLDFRGGAPVVVPSQDGRGVDYPATATALGPVLVGPAAPGGPPRQVAAVYADQPAKLTTEKLTELGITGLVGEFTTGGFAADSGQNIKRAADQINGLIIAPGETFSLNAATNPRDAAHGYVDAGIIEDGHASRGVGGGVSQVATTLYNAAYFGGMTLVSHKEHSFYISRYPPGREATVFDDIIDLKFRNDGPTAVMIQTVWTPSNITIRLLGTKQYDVTSATGPRTNPTDPKTITIPDGEPCSPSKGAPGFTVTDTRTLKDLKTGAVRSDPTRTVRYNPSPIVSCGG